MLMQICCYFDNSSTGVQLANFAFGMASLLAGVSNTFLQANDVGAGYGKTHKILAAGWIPDFLEDKPLTR